MVNYYYTAIGVIIRKITELNEALWVRERWVGHGRNRFVLANITIFFEITMPK